MFRMLMDSNHGGTVQLHRFKVEYEEARPQSNAEDAVIKAEYFVSGKDKDAFIQLLGEKDHAVTPINQAGNEWIDGRVFPSWDEAERAIGMGEGTYFASLPLTTEEKLANLMLALVEGGII